MARCEYCRGVEYTDEPFTVVTQMGRLVEVTFAFCPVCGTDLRVNEEANAESAVSPNG